MRQAIRRRLRFSGLRYSGGDGAADRAEMVQIGSLMYLACICVAYFAALSPTTATANRPAIALVATAGLVVVALVLVLFDRLPRWAFPALTVVAIVLITLAVHFDGAGASAFPLFYIWATAFACYYFPPRTAAALMLFMGGAYALVLVIGDAAGGLDRWIFTMVTLALLGALIAVLRSRVEALLAKLSEAANTDPLTALPNRRAFEQTLDLELERARRGERFLSIVVGDLDWFKRVNDERGHAEGDRVLERTARILREEKRRVDSVARLGGEEFALTIPDTRAGDALVAAERLRAAIRQEFAADRIPITISFGVATFPVHGGGENSLMTAADRALYAAKELGRDRSVIYSSEVDRVLRGVALGADGGTAPELDFVLELARTLDRRYGTGRPSERVAVYAESLARELGLPESRAARLRIAGLLHDIGKITVPDDVLSQSGPLVESRIPELREHPRVGADLIRGRGLEDVREWILNHHERPDGDGFPRGLVGEEVPLEARILGVADAYEAMTGQRTTRTPMPDEEARAELERGAGTRWDPVVVAAFLELLDRRRVPAR